MSVWHYEAIDLRDPAKPAPRSGEIAGDSAAEARAALRAVGLQVTAIFEDRKRKSRGAPKSNDVARDSAIDRHLRSRRGQDRADLFDAISTLLASGVPLMESIDALVAGGESMPRALRRALVAMREELRSGAALSSAMRSQSSWFDESEVAMVSAAELSGTLNETLRDLALRQAKGAEVSRRLASALAYPALVACVGLGVAVFLATRTLPQLAVILEGAKVEVPRLTAIVMLFGQALARWWHVLAIVILLTLVGGATFLSRAIARMSPEARTRFDRSLPLVARRLALAQASLRTAELLRCGVPLVEALRVAAPAHRGATAGLAIALRDAAARLESGRSLDEAFDRSAWFDAEFRRLVAVGEAGGELDSILLRVGERYERQAARLVDRLASALEPAAILLLSALVGTVVMAAVLPLVRLQEVLR